MKESESILSRVQIAKPCSADWESMSGNDRERACQLCHLNVYNISAMSKNEAESFLAERLPQGRVCVRLYRRTDGTIITDNCPRGLRAARDAARRVRQLASAAASLVLTFFYPVAAQSQSSCTDKDNASPHFTMGKMRAAAPGLQGNVTQQTRPNMVQGDVMIAPRSEMGGAAPMLTDMVAYKARMQAKIRSVWQQPARSGLRIKVTFKLGFNGKPTDIKLASSSGDAALDKTALDAIKTAGPFEKLPAGVADGYAAEYLF
jgi:TonB family protein